ncbi:hypothetical protein [Psychromicrobium xiongbiense]|uniref:hypothetical protein n=1 Tax=Psychromicrobium xiongbiense TaxID=3051184 RepID=UPI002555AEA6|nr:hypothetical protein [Psychromicrobium sp. YIM S02556]
MSEFLGMEPAAVRDLAQDFSRCAQDFRGTEVLLSATFSRSRWQGPDATRIRTLWSGSYRQLLQNVAQDLDKYATILREQATEQDAASAVEGSKGGPAGGGLAGGPGTGLGVGPFHKVPSPGPSLGGLVGMPGFGQHPQPLPADPWGLRNPFGPVQGNPGADFWGDLWRSARGADHQVRDGLKLISKDLPWPVPWLASKIELNPLKATGNVVEGAGHFAGDAGNLARLYGMIAVGLPVPSGELEAAKLLALTSGLGLAGVTASLGHLDLKLGARGTAVVGDAVPVAVNDQIRPDGTVGTPGLQTPSSMADLVAMTTSEYRATGSPELPQGGIRITTVQGEDGVNRYVVSIPGTQNWSPTAEGSVFDLSSNLATAAGQRSTMTQGVIDAIKANVPAGSEILLAGHSQGGMSAMNIASDPTALPGYRLTNVVTYGSPVDNDHPAPGVQVVAFQHPRDVVPLVDLNGVTYNAPPAVTPSNVQLVDLPNPQSVGYLDVPGQHNGSNYNQSVRQVENQGQLAGLDPSFQKFLQGDPSRTQAVDVPISKKTS